LLNKHFHRLLRHVSTTQRKVEGKLVAIHPHLHHLCTGGQSLCPGRQLGAAAVPGRKKRDLLGIICTPYHPAVAALCAADQYSAGTVPVFQELPAPYVDENQRIMSQPQRLAVFASGTGSNARRLIEHFQSGPLATVALIVCNKPGAGVLQIAAEQGIPTLLVEKERFFRGDGYVADLKSQQIDFVILAGFLWKVPGSLIEAFPHRIVNIHPALLPNYGGKGMYGRYVHEAVLAAGDPESGITIHEVDEQYDHGAHLFQATCPVLPGDTPDSLAHRIHELEHRHYPRVVEEWVRNTISS